MRDYAKVRARFWTGETGRKLRALGHLEMLVANYLITGPHANWIGLYYLPVQYIAHDLGCPLEGASKALRRVCEAGFATYDDASEHIWVHEGAREQIEDGLHPNDKRVAGIAKELRVYSKTPLALMFHAKYVDSFHLPDATEMGLTNKPLARGSIAPSKPLRSQDQDQEQEQDLLPQAALVLEPSKPKQPSPVSMLKTAFCSWYQVRYGEEYAWSGKEAGLAKTLMDRAGEKGVVEVMRRVDIAAAQSWRNANVTLGTMVEAWNSLASTLVAKGTPTVPITKTADIPSTWRTMYNLAARESEILAQGKTPPWWSLEKRWTMTHDPSGQPLIPVRNGRRADAP